ncbi:hypothetical protein GCM10008026_08310 [Chelatococcus composti]|nr:hypothetical protein GCM10008026_08310 [Chelatococcus composti]
MRGTNSPAAAAPPAASSARRVKEKRVGSNSGPFTCLVSSDKGPGAPMFDQAAGLLRAATPVRREASAQ